jgi:cell division protease FtsH
VTPRTKRNLSRVLKFTIAYFALSYLFLGLGPVQAANIPAVLAPMRQFLMTGMMLMLFMVGQFAAMFWFLGRGASYVVYPGEYDTTFDNVRGQDAAVAAVKDSLRFFQGAKDFEEMGGTRPHGLLMEGPPGTGKTLLAKAMAGETGVPFLFASGSGFANMFMGMSQFRVRGMFKKARKLSDTYGGCIIFIDELDAAGGARMGMQAPGQSGMKAEVNRIMMMGGAGGGGIVNELLAQMDGFVTPKGLRRHFNRIFFRTRPEVPHYNVLVIGATNLASTLDPALLRPGRFDRKLHVGLPSTKGRADIAAYYLAKVSHYPIDVEKLSKLTLGWSPASIENLIREALVLALQEFQAGRRAHPALAWDDIVQAKLAEEIGLAQNADYSDKEKRMVAVHEAGHAVTSYLTQRGERVINVVTIRKRDSALGLVSTQEEEDTYLHTKEMIRAMVMVSLAGQVAEEVEFGTSTSGPSSDLRNATFRAAQYVGAYGMGDKLASVAASQKGAEDIVAAVMGSKERGAELEAMLQELKAETTALLTEHRYLTDALADALVEKGELVGEEITDLFEEAERLETGYSELRKQQDIEAALVQGTDGYVFD